ncbi:MAG: ribonuclease catalytic domain-containing protein [Termitinemataceae bacterium]|nr:MAG: ribonuclease catalytic domain-containing protein [Termitinemataceae bacterium]
MRETGDKIVIETAAGRLRVREKDIELLHPGPVANLSELSGRLPEGFAEEAWELFIEEEAAPSLRELCELAGGWTANNAWQIWLLISDGLYFEGSLDALRPKNRKEVEAEKARRGEKQAETAARSLFLSRFKTKKLELPADSKFMQDIEALALGKSSKSRTMKEAGFEETPESAHKLLLETGFWTEYVNPYPSRFNISFFQPKEDVPPPPDEDRLDLTHLDAYAIDDEESSDPDDAVSLEPLASGQTLYVHIADPSASILPDSASDREARSRGATFYAPEGIARMLGGGALDYYALGIKERSPALTIKLTLKEDGAPAQTEIFRSVLKVTRLSYESASKLKALSPLCELAQNNLRRRIMAGAAQIDFPEVQIKVKDGHVNIIAREDYSSRSMVRECMLIAGEGIAAWALERRIPFPFISQQIEALPKEVLPGLAGYYQLRRCMRPRVLSVKPGFHEGLGLDIYTQGTSPLRRYTDLLVHQQINSVLRGENVLGEEELLMRLVAAERAAQEVSKAERASRAHWTAVYLSEKKGEVFEATVMDLRGAHAVVFVPALGLETQASIPHGTQVEPNSKILLKVAGVRIPEAEIRWTTVEV